MIRVNLTRSRVASGSEEGSAPSNIVIDSSTPGGPDVRSLVTKAAVMLIGTLGLWMYEKQNIDRLSGEMAVVNAELNKVRQEQAKKAGELEKLKDIEPQAQALSDKLKVLRAYSKQRLENLQSLDYIQSVIPERVWLSSVNYETKRYRLTGNSMETVDLTEFVNKLEGSAYFQDVIVIQDTEKPIQPTGKIREFEMTARSGVKVE